MTGTTFRTAGNPPLWPYANSDAAQLKEAWRAARVPLLFGLRLWASVCLALYIAFWLQLDNAQWAGTSAAIVCQPQLGASLRKGWFRMIGTLVEAVMIVVLTACFPQDRGLFLGGLALWGGASAFAATVLRNFASYAAALAGYTAAIVATDQLGATGGPNGDAFMLAVTRASEICIGIVCAGVVLAGTDLGGARRRLAALFVELSSGIMSRFAGDLAIAGPDLPDATPVRREFIRRVIALEPTQIRSPVNGWVTNLLAQLGDYANVGTNVISLVDADSFWIDGYFEETNLGSIHEGDRATIKLMGYKQLIRGHVGSLARGINVANAQPNGQGLATVNPIFTWVRLAQRIPVRIHLDQVPEGVVLSAGMTATMQINPLPPSTTQ